MLLLDVSRKGAEANHERWAQDEGYGRGDHAAVGAWPEVDLRVVSDACAGADNKVCEEMGIKWRSP